MDATIGFQLLYLFFCCALALGVGVPLVAWIVHYASPPSNSGFLRGALEALGLFLICLIASPFLVLLGAAVSVLTVELVWDLGVWARRGVAATTAVLAFASILLARR